jgi:hypothetical protein
MTDKGTDVDTAIFVLEGDVLSELGRVGLLELGSVGLVLDVSPPPGDFVPGGESGEDEDVGLFDDAVGVYSSCHDRACVSNTYAC